MKWFYIFLVVLIAGCEPQGDAPKVASSVKHVATQVELRGNLNAFEFRQALIGKWISLFEHPSKRNIKELEFTTEGVANLTVVHNQDEQKYFGKYSVEFEREPYPDKDTFARINISGDNPIELRRVNFGLHNGINQKEGMLLRVDAEPYGALKRR